jgi:hypothetical protein
MKWWEGKFKMVGEELPPVLLVRCDPPWYSRLWACLTLRG